MEFLYLLRDGTLSFSLKIPQSWPQQVLGHDKIPTNSGCADSSRSLFSFLIIHLPSNIIKAFYDHVSYSKKGIEMLEQVCKIQEPCMKNSILSNLLLLFGQLQGSTQETPFYLGIIWNLIFCCKLWVGNSQYRWWTSWQCNTSNPADTIMY